MSDTFTKIISENPYSLVLAENFEDINAFLKGSLSISNAVLEFNEMVEFIDCEENLEKITCPSCGRIVDFEWWGEEVENVFRNDFVDLTVQMPCCEKNFSLNDLKYYMPCGFASAAIAISDGDIDDTDLAEIEKIAGEKLRVIRGRY